MRKLLTLAMFLLTALPASATDFYYAATLAGSNNGTSCANAYAYTDATNGISTAGKWVAGNTLHICGTITGSGGATAITAAGNGSSGNPITIKFETGAQLDAPYWGGNAFSSSAGAISCVGHSYITIDGGVNGIIQNTANGTSLANQQASTGVNFLGCAHTEIKNLHVLNIYVHTENDNGGISPNDTVGIGDGNADFVYVHNNQVTQAEYVGNGGYNGAGSVRAPYGLTTHSTITARRSISAIALEDRLHRGLYSRATLLALISRTGLAAVVLHATMTVC